MSKKAGWARPLNANKHHFFAENEATSVCGRWMYFGHDREPDTFESPDDCVVCRKKLSNGNAIRAAGIGVKEE
ncbi:hypothetical protein [Citrobacter freundii]|uniref:hypothetical protein n=1 Tax=Citrobacter freundii TaxID=546 RepID=UPI001BCF13A0|nr:hypothetical protein [Citrobacter freundii]